MGYERSGRRSGRDADYGYRENRSRGYDNGGYCAGYDRRYGNEGRPPADYDYEDRDFFDCAGDEVRSWFGDEEAERRPRLDERCSETEYDREYQYRSALRTTAWVGHRSAFPRLIMGPTARQGPQAIGVLEPVRIAGRGHMTPINRGAAARSMPLIATMPISVARNHARFEKEFGSWRSHWLDQRDALNRVAEHKEVVGSSSSHVGTVDKVRYDGSF